MSPVEDIDDDDILEFVDDDPVVESPLERCWRVLVVDDEADVHETTVLALRDLSVEGRKLEFLHAYSAQEAFEFLADEKDLAVVLLDVVMESEQAGLHLVRRIREELDYQAVRIILRTGQPGYAPEIETIRTYDINDYKTKSELTRVRLFTSLTVAIRSYRQIRQHEMGRRGLELIVSASTGLGKLRAMHRFAAGVVTQLCALLEIAPEGLVCVASSMDGAMPRVIAAAGRYLDLIQCPLEQLPEDKIRIRLEHCLSRRQHVFDQGTCLYFGVPDTQGVAAYVDTSRALDEVDRNLLEVFCANVTVGFENVLLHEQLVESAYYDPLLRLPNRNRLIQLIDDKEHTADAVLALVDIDDFAEINTVLDHRYGDQVLRAVATRLEQSFDPSVVLARLTSDVFALLGPASRIDPARIEAIFSVPFELEAEPIRISATASLIQLSQCTTGGGELLKDASIALKQAKILNRGRVACFTSELSLSARERIRMLTSLRAAFSADRLFLVFQPQVDMDSGRVMGAEALLRWKTEEGGFVPPDRFIPLAEQSGLMIPIGEWVLRGACHQLRRLKGYGLDAPVMAVNVSQTQFREPDFVARLGRIIEEYGVDPGSIELELTESVAIGHISATAAKIAELRAMGVSIALDDFGTGYSSLSVLKELDVDRLKIDRAFVAEIAEDGDPGRSCIADLVISLGQQLDLSVIAEGVETESQRTHLLAQGCREAQGYLFARPMPAELFEKWMIERVSGATPG